MLPIFNTLNVIGKDSYFIRLKEQPDCYVHLDIFTPMPAKVIIYRICLGTVGAVIWDKETAEKWINNNNLTKLELIEVKNVLPEDGSLN